MLIAGLGLDYPFHVVKALLTVVYKLKKNKKATDVKILLRCTYNVNQSNTVQKLTFRGVLREILAFWKDLK